MIQKLLLLLWFVGACAIAHSQVKTYPELFKMKTGLVSRSISFENPTGTPGEGGKAANKQLGVGRKGAAYKVIAANEEVTLCNITGTGTIRHIWMGGEASLQDPVHRKLMRSTIVRAYWDGQKYPSIECPLGDFMGLAHSKVTAYQSAVHSVGEQGALNIWLPMPFRKNARIILTNDSEVPFALFYQIDYTINDKHKKDIGCLHVSFRRENPTTPKQDFEILPKRTGEGRFIGAVIGVRTLFPGWWGEGEVKMYMDGDTQYPTICGTGSEDWICLAYGVQQTPFQYHGCNLNFKSGTITKSRNVETNQPEDMNREYVSMYRWHILDPINWEKECRVTMQQIGCCYHERYDDWSAAAFWYEPIPSQPLPPLPSAENRTKDLDEVYGVK